MNNSATNENSRLEQANALGLAYLRAILLLNGGGILALLTFLGNASSQTMLTLPLGTIQDAMKLFLAAIASMMVSLLVSYSYTATSPNEYYRQFWDRHIIRLNFVCGLVALVCFLLAILSLVFGAVETVPT